MLSIKETWQRLIEQLPPPTLTSQRLPLQQALGRVCAQAVHAQHALPPFDNSAMDGYALGHPLAQSSLQFSLQPQVWAAGHAADAAAATPLQAGQAMRIFTGAPLPAGCWAVVPQEDVSVHSAGDGQRLLCNKAPKAGQHRRLAGSELAAGQLLLAQGEKVHALHIGLLATQGLVDLAVYQRLRVGVLSTGSELQQAGLPLASGQIYDANRPQLLALLAACGFEAIDLGAVPDDAAATRALLAQGAEQCDCIISSGGASVGDADHMRAVVQELGEILHWKVAIKPGKPFAFGRVGSCPFFALPGNPAAAVVTFLLLVLPWLRWAAGGVCARPLPSYLPLAQAAGNSDMQRSLFVRAVYVNAADKPRQVQALAEQASAALISMAQAQVLLELAPQSAYQAGDLLPSYDLIQFLAG